MTSDKHNISEHCPEIAAALGELMPSVPPDFADEIKQAVKSELHSEANEQGGNSTQNVSVPLTHYIRIAQFNAAFLGMIGGLLIGVVLGGTGVFFVMDWSQRQTETAQASSNNELPMYAAYRQMLEDDPAFRAMDYDYKQTKDINH